MKRSHVRRVKTVVQCLGVAGSLAALVHCGGGTNPPAADDSTPDSGQRQPTNTDGGTGVVTFPDVSLTDGMTFGDSGFTDCGKQSSAKTFTLKNTLGEIVNYNITLSNGSDFYDVSPPTGGIPSNGQSIITVTPKAIPAESDVTPDLYAGTLEIAFPGHGTPQQLKLHQTARGAIVTMTGGTAAGTGGTTFDLGSVKVGDTKQLAVSLANAGNLDVQANLTLGSTTFTIGGAQVSNADLAPSSSQSKPLSVTPQTAGALTDTLSIAYNTSAVHCKAPPTTATVTALGTTSVGVSPGALDFGQVNCGTTGAFQTVSISSTIAMNFTPVLTKGGLSPYTLADSTGNAVAGGTSIHLDAASTYTLRVVPKGIPPVSDTVDNGFGDTLSVSTDVPGDTVHAVDLKETAKGAVLKFDLQSVTVSGPVNTLINTNYNLVNTGNTQVPYTITASPLSGANTPGFKTNLSTGNAVIGNTAGVLISTTPTSSGSTTNGTLSVALGAAGGVLCADLPPAMPLSVTGTGSAVTYNPANLNFGTVDCNSGPTNPQSFTLASTVNTNMKMTLGLGASSAFTLAQDSANTKPIPNASSVPVGPGAPYTVWVIPKAINAPASTADNAYGDTLTLTSDIPAEPVNGKTIPLTMTAHGAIFAFPSVLVAQKTNPVPFTIQNTGNASGTISVTATGTTVNTAGSYILGGGASQGFSIPLNASAGTINVTPTTGTGFPICGQNSAISVSPPPN